MEEELPTCKGLLLRVQGWLGATEAVQKGLRSILQARIRGLKRWDEGRWGNPKIRVLI